MSDARAAQAADADLRTIVLIVYTLFVLAMFNGATAIAGVVLAYIKRDEARGTLWESHFRNAIHLFWIALVTAAIGLVAALQAFGGIAVSLIATNGNPPPSVIGLLAALVPLFILCGAIFFFWYLYRTLRGLIHALEARPY